MFFKDERGMLLFYGVLSLFAIFREITRRWEACEIKTSALKPAPGRNGD